METVQMVLDKKLLQATDRAARQTKRNRSALVRDALREHLRRLEYAPGKNATACDWSPTWIGGWHFGTVDRFEPCHYQGAVGKPDLFVHNTDWFGMLRSATPWVLDKIYYRWIHNYKYGNNF